MAETILSIQHLHKKYGKIHAVNNVSLTIQRGNVYGILGPNGSGKSTTLGIVLNVVNKTEGSYTWFEGTMNTHQALKKVGAIIERPNFYPYMTAHENLQLVCKIKNIPYKKIEEKLQLVGLWERRDSKFKTFSLGMKQRLAIASALLNDPEMLILDEPTNGLDPQGIHQIRDLIRLIASQGTTILLASHLLDEVEKVCSHVLILHFGKILYSGTVDGMTQKNTYFELQSDQTEAMLQYLRNRLDVDEIKTTANGVEVFFKHPTTGNELNQDFFAHGIILNHLCQKRISLEQQFLEITK